jgi:hypothetical protein
MGNPKVLPISVRASPASRLVKASRIWWRVSLSFLPNLTPLAGRLLSVEGLAVR